MRTPSGWKIKRRTLRLVDGSEPSGEILRGALPAMDRLDDALLALDLSPLAARPVRTLSAGQRRRVALARVVLTQAFWAR